MVQIGVDPDFIPKQYTVWVLPIAGIKIEVMFDFVMSQVGFEQLGDKEPFDVDWCHGLFTTLLVPAVEGRRAYSLSVWIADSDSRCFDSLEAFKKYQLMFATTIGVILASEFKLTDPFKQQVLDVVNSTGKKPCVEVNMASTWPRDLFKNLFCK